MKGLLLTVSLALGAAGAGCGTANLPPPNDQWSAAQVDLGRAQASGAPNVPDAKLHLQLAEEDMQKGKALIGTDNNRATSLITLARAEAQLAVSMARASQHQAEAAQAQASLPNRGAQ
jgi:Domain of unknown function (DUF4398)